MAIARPATIGWRLTIEPVGPLDTLFQRLFAMAGGDAVMLGVDFPIGLPRAYVTRHLDPAGSFPAFLKSLADRPRFFDVAPAVEDISVDRPFYPRRGLRGMTRLSHALALGLDSAQGLSRACDRATAHRPAGAPLFWTLGANQSGKAAISAWRDLLLPAMLGGVAMALWPFDGPLRQLIRPGMVTVAETYPADALRQLGMRPIGSKRRQADRLALIPGIAAAMKALDAHPTEGLQDLLTQGFGADPAGEDRLDCLLGVLCVLLVLAGRRPDAPPADPWLTRWEGWVLGQDSQIPMTLEPLSKVMKVRDKTKG